MLNVAERLQGMVEILIDSNAELEMMDLESTGYIAVPPEFLRETVLALLTEISDGSCVSLDLGCGNGGWALLIAAAGIPSYGIDINPLLVNHARQNYDQGVACGFIDPLTPCSFIVGDMIPVKRNASYMAFRKGHEIQSRSMPIGAMVEDSYSRLPVTIATADIIYCWSWPTQSEFLFNMLQDEAKEGALFVLPSYEIYIKREHDGKIVDNRLKLIGLHNEHGVYVGRRAT